MRLSREDSRGDTFGHRIERIRAASRSTDPRLLPMLLNALQTEPDPAVRKLLALSALRVAQNCNMALDEPTATQLQSYLEWSLPR